MSETAFRSIASTERIGQRDNALMRVLKKSARRQIAIKVTVDIYYRWRCPAKKFSVVLILEEKKSGVWFFAAPATTSSLSPATKLV
jgi:hypothetical protein